MQMIRAFDLVKVFAIRQAFRLAFDNLDIGAVMLDGLRAVALLKLFVRFARVALLPGERSLLRKFKQDLAPRDAQRGFVAAFAVACAPIGEMQVKHLPLAQRFQNQRRLGLQHGKNRRRGGLFAEAFARPRAGQKFERPPGLRVLIKKFAQFLVEKRRHVGQAFDVEIRNALARHGERRKEDAQRRQFALLRRAGWINNLRGRQPDRRLIQLLLFFDDLQLRGAVELAQIPLQFGVHFAQMQLQFALLLDAPALKIEIAVLHRLIHFGFERREFFLKFPIQLVFFGLKPAIQFLLFRLERHTLGGNGGLHPPVGVALRGVEIFAPHDGLRLKSAVVFIAFGEIRFALAVLDILQFHFRDALFLPPFFHRLVGGDIDARRFLIFQGGVSRRLK